MDGWLTTHQQHRTSNKHAYLLWKLYFSTALSWHDSTNSKLEELHDAVLLIAYPSSSSLSKRHVAQATSLGVQSVKNNSWLLPKFAPFNSWLLPKFVPFNSWPLPKFVPISSWLLPKFAPFHSWHYQNSPLSTADFYQNSPSFEHKTLNKFFLFVKTLVLSQKVTKDSWGIIIEARAEAG